MDSLPEGGAYAAAVSPPCIYCVNGCVSTLLVSFTSWVMLLSYDYLFKVQTPQVRLCGACYPFFVFSRLSEGHVLSLYALIRCFPPFQGAPATVCSICSPYGLLTAKCLFLRLRLWTHNLNSVAAHSLYYLFHGSSVVNHTHYPFGISFIFLYAQSSTKVYAEGWKFVFPRLTKPLSLCVHLS